MFHVAATCNGREHLSARRQSVHRRLDRVNVSGRLRGERCLRAGNMPQHSGAGAIRAAFVGRLRSRPDPCSYGFMGRLVGRSSKLCAMISSALLLLSGTDARADAELLIDLRYEVDPALRGCPSEAEFAIHPRPAASATIPTAPARPSAQRFVPGPTERRIEGVIRLERDRQKEGGGTSLCRAEPRLPRNDEDRGVRHGCPDPGDGQRARPDHARIGGH